MSLATEYDALLLDLDGTMWEGGRAIPGAVEAVNASKLPAMYVTNNASKAPAAVAEELKAIGLSVNAENVMTSAQAAVRLVAERVPAGSTVLIVGAESFKDLAREAGFNVTDTADDNPVAVLHGHNPETGWKQLSEAALSIRNGAEYFASNLDTTLPMQRGLHVGNGSMVAAVVSATGVTPTSAGKPLPAMFHLAAKTLGAQRPLAVGDRLDTDIQGGVSSEMDTLQVVTGVSGHFDIVHAPASQRATYIADSMYGLQSEPKDLLPSAQGGFAARIDGHSVTLSGGESGSTAIQALRTVLDVVWSAFPESVPPLEITAEGVEAERALGEWR